MLMILMNLQQTKAKIAKGLENVLQEEKMEQAAADAILAKITTSAKISGTDCDLIVEAAIETWKSKTDIQRITGYL